MWTYSEDTTRSIFLSLFTNYANLSFVGYDKLSIPARYTEVVLANAQTSWSDINADITASSDDVYKTTARRKYKMERAIIESCVSQFYSLLSLQTRWYSASIDSNSLMRLPVGLAFANILNNRYNGNSSYDEDLSNYGASLQGLPTVPTTFYTEIQKNLNAIKLWIQMYLSVRLMDFDPILYPHEWPNE